MKSQPTKSRFLETKGRKSLQGLDHFLLPFLLLTRTSHVYSSSSIGLCLNSTCSIFQSLLCHFVPSLYSLPSGLWVTKAMNCMSFMQQHLWAYPFHPEQPCAAQTLSSHPSPDASHQLTTDSCFMLVARYLCLMALSKLCFCHKNSTCALSHLFLEQREILFPLHNRTRLWPFMAQQNLLYNSVLTFDRGIELTMLSTLLYLF